jgi:hypothetical protein
MRYVASLILIAGLFWVGCGDDEESKTVSADECISMQKWTGGDEESPLMNPGQACNECHRAEDEGPIFRFAGTLYEGYTQKDNCFGVQGYTVEITDANGTKHTARSNAAGNFFSEGAPIAAPYTALVRAPDGSERPMLTPQMDVDCNTCHGAMGTLGAPGRIIIP